MTSADRDSDLPQRAADGRGIRTRISDSPDAPLAAIWDLGSDSPKRRPNWLARLLIVIISGTTLVLGMLAVIAMQLSRPGPSSADVALVVPSGTSVTGIAELLINQGVSAADTPFSLGVKLFGGDRPLQAGEFVFPIGSTPLDAMKILQDGSQLTRRLTIPEGVTVAQVLPLIAAADGLDTSDVTLPADGKLLPETYHYTRGDTAQDIVDRMADAMQRALAELWPGRDENLPIQSPEEAVILASIVEKETGIASERAMVAGVFINRLRIGMPLQADPTVAYAVSAGQGLDRSLTRADLQFDDPYNTYVYAGLPPGPIANPGRAAIEAVLHPATTGALYFVADGTGGHAFAETLAEHNTNVARYRASQR